MKNIHRRGSHQSHCAHSLIPVNRFTCQWMRLLNFVYPPNPKFLPKQFTLKCTCSERQPVIKFLAVQFDPGRLVAASKSVHSGGDVLLPPNQISGVPFTSLPLILRDLLLACAHINVSFASVTEWKCQVQEADNSNRLLWDTAWLLSDSVTVWLNAVWI